MEDSLYIHTHIHAYNTDVNLRFTRDSVEVDEDVGKLPDVICIEREGISELNITVQLFPIGGTALSTLMKSQVHTDVILTTTTHTHTQMAVTSRLKTTAFSSQHLTNQQRQCVHPSTSPSLMTHS